MSLDDSQERTKNKMKTRLSVLLMTFVIAAGMSHAQQTAIYGRIADTTDAAIQSASVHAQSVNGGTIYLSVTDNSGSYQFPALTGDTYVVRVDAKGFSSAQSKLEILVGKSLELDFRLKPASLVTEVEVTAQATMVDTVSSAVGGQVDPETAAQTPLNGRNWLQLTSLVPGVRVNAVDESPLPSSEITGFQINVDGQQVTQNYSYSSGYAQPRFSRDAISEFQVITNRFDTTQGRSTGLQINVQTKAGSNSNHGSAFGYFRNNVFNAADNFEKKVLTYSDSQYGGTFGGPIRKDKLFYFGSYEGEYQPNTVVLTPYGFSSVYPTYTHSNNETNDEFLARFDYALTPRDHFSLRSSAYTTSTPYYTINSTDNPTTAYSTNKNNYGSLLTYTASRGTHFVNEARVGFTHNETKSNPTLASMELDFTGTTIGGNQDTPENINQDVWNIRDDIYEVYGKHNLRFGGEFLHQLLHGSFGMESRGVATLAQTSSTSFPALFPNLFDTSTWDWNSLSALTTSYVQRFGPVGAGFPFNAFGAWVQDDWKVFRNFTVNLGLRYDNDLGIFDPHVKLTTGVQLPSGGDNNNFAPRVGFVWSPLSNKNFVIRGGAGIYFSEIPTNMIQDTAMFNGQTEVIASSGAQTNLLHPFNGASSAQILANPQAYTQAIQVMASDVVTPWTAELSVGAQGELPGHVSVSADYLHNRTHHNWIRNDANVYYDSTTGFPKDPTIYGRPYSEYTNIKTFTTPRQVGAIYDALLVSVQKQLVRGLRGSVAYTLAREKDNDDYGPYFYANNPFNYSDGWGNSIDNQLHTIRANGNYQWRYGLRLGVLYNYGSGSNQYVFSIQDPLNILNTLNRTFCGSDATNPVCTGKTETTYNNPAHNHLDTKSGFDIVDANSFVGRPVHRVDSNFAKDITLHNKYRLTLQVEAFNLLNHSNYGTYTTYIESPSFGQPADNTSLSYSPRMLQFSAHLHF